jgi:hypothetical protein
MWTRQFRGPSGAFRQTEERCLLRRVITGVDKRGRAVFVADGEPEGITITEGAEPVELMWGWDSAPRVPNDGTKPIYRNYFPPAGGVRVLIVPMAPDSAPAKADPALTTERFPGLLTDAKWDPNQPGMHTTETVDVGLILEGSLILELDDGATRQLDAGDWYVLNGTRHAWRNPFEKRALMAIVLTGLSAPDPTPRAELPTETRADPATQPIKRLVDTI